MFKSIITWHGAPLWFVCLLCGLRYGNIWDTTLEPYVLWEEEIQYWDSGLFMSSGTTVESRGSYIEFSFEYRNVRNYKQKCNMVRLWGWKKSLQFISVFVQICVFVPHPVVAWAQAAVPLSCSPSGTPWHDSDLTPRSPETSRIDKWARSSFKRTAWCCSGRWICTFWSICKNFWKS